MTSIPRHKRLLRLLALLGLFALATLLGSAQATAGETADPPEVPDKAYGEGAVEEGNPRVETRLLVESDRAEPGETLRVGVLFSIDPEWHVYWRNSGDSGMASDVLWKGEGLTYGDLRWPAPHVFEEPSGEIVTFGYSDRVLLFSEATVGEEAAGEATVKARVDYLACKRDCIPGSAELERTITVGSSDEESEEKEKADEPVDHAGLFDTWAAKVPRTPTQLGIATEVVYAQKPIRPGDTVRAAVGLDYCDGDPNSCTDFQVTGGVDAYRFIPDTTSQVEFKTVAVEDHPSAKKGQVLVLEGKASPNAPEDGERFSGVVHLKGPDGETSVLVESSIPRGAEGSEVEEVDSPLFSMIEGELPGSSGPSESASAAGGSQKSTMGIWQALLFAFLGGMILNLMPCVFPVLALKVTSFAELVHEDSRHKLMHGLAYTGGIVGSLLLLAMVVVGLRMFGTQVGWGFQFQNPVFPAVLAAAVVIFALNLFGVFEIGVQSNTIAQKTREASGLQRSVGEGILAVVLATPCSAPFLGTAVGFALTGSAFTILGIFAVLGLGLASPFVVLTMVPGLSGLLPRPGDWMVYLKKFLGFTLLGAAIWLVWIVGRSAGVDAMARVLGFLAVCGLAAWVYGQTQGKQSMAARNFAVVALLLVIPAGWWGLDIEAGGGEALQNASAAESGGIAWEPWSEERVQRELDEGRPVFVDFTADWCITCKVNERTVLSTNTVRSAFATHDVATLKADWTDGDEDIRQKLREFGKAGVPMYLVYRPSHPNKPRMLSEVITIDDVVSALK